MNRCAHGVYLPAWAKDGMNPYCSACENFGKVPHQRAVILPRSSGVSLSTDGPRANEGSYGCPECGCTAWLRVDENGSDASRECADCGHKYQRRLSIHQQAQVLLAELEKTA